MASRTETYYTSIVIDLSNVSISEEDVKSFTIAVYKGTSTINESITKLKQVSIEAYYDESTFTYKPIDNVVIKDCEVGIYYYFKIKHNGGDWSELVSERAGDSTNNLSFDSTDSSVFSFVDKISIKQKFTDTDSDAEKFEVFISSETFTDYYSLEAQTTPSTPAVDAVPNLIIPIENIENNYLIFDINDIADYEFKHIYVRGVDRSGNLTSFFYVGYGRLAIKQDDNEFVDGTIKSVSNIGGSYYSKNWLYDDGTEDVNNRVVEWFLKNVTDDKTFAYADKYCLKLSSGLAGISNPTTSRSLMMPIDNNESYLFRFRIAYDYDSTTAVSNDASFTITVKEYNSSNTLLATTNIIDNKKVSTYADTVWYQVSEKFPTLNASTTQFVLEITLPYYSDTMNLYFDTFSLERLPKTENITPGEFQGSMSIKSGSVMSGSFKGTFTSSNNKGGLNISSRTVLTGATTDGNGEITFTNVIQTFEDGLLVTETAGTDIVIQTI